jgi:hypothetical protein
MLTTYSPYPCQQPGAQRRLPTPIRYALPSVSIRASGGRSAGPSGRPIAATLACRSGGFRSLSPDSPRLSAAARLADFGRAHDKPDTMDRDGRETTKEAI